MTPAKAVCRLSICLFGPFEAQLDGEPLPPLRTRKVQWLLALLILRHGREVRRDWLAGLLWPDHPTARALALLRRELNDLRRALGSEAVRLSSPTPHTLSLDLAGAAVDVAAFDAAIVRGDLAALEQAAFLYRGPLLEGCAEEWVVQERSQREQALLTALESLAGRALAEGAAAAAEGYLRRAVAVDPLRESAQRALMQGLAASGNYAAAIQVYRELRLLLHREINTEPDRKSTALFEQIRSIARRRAHAAPSSTDVRARAGPQRLFPGGQSVSAADAPLLQPLAAPSHNLSAQPTPLIGREKELTVVREALLSDGARLLTLTGPGGSGKTRLGLQVAADLLDDFRDGAFFVDLAPIRDPALVTATIAQVLGVREAEGRGLLQSLEESLREKQVLLLLDNFEQVLSAAPLVAGLLGAAPRLKVLVTSRAALRLRGEKEFPVPPLPLPDRKRAASVEAVSQYAGVALFIQRARDVKPDFVVTEETAPAVVEICHRLDGLPLAIELAAARIRLFAPQALLLRLENRLKLLTDGARDLPARQQTLRSAITWSYDLLTEDEKTLFRRLSIFVGGFTLAAVEAVCDPTGDLKDDIWEGVASLLDQSLLQQQTLVAHRPPPLEGSPSDTHSTGALPVISDAAEGEPRFMMLETIREFGRERLADSGEEVTVQQQHARYYLELAEGQASREALEREVDNLRAALAWSCTEEGDAEIALRLAVRLTAFWDDRGNWSEGMDWLKRALARAPDEPTPTRAKALCAAGRLSLTYACRAEGRRLLEESLAAFRALGDEVQVMHTLSFLGNAHLELRDPAAARACYSESLSIARETGNKKMMAGRLGAQGILAIVEGNYREARTFNEESLALYEELGEREQGMWVIGNLGMTLTTLGEPAKARPLHEEGLAYFRQDGSRPWLATALAGLGRTLFWLGELASARALVQEALEIDRQIRDRRRSIGCLNQLAAIAQVEGEFDQARCFYEESLAIAQDLGESRRPFDTLIGLGDLCARQGDDAAARAFYEEALRDQRAMPDISAVAVCLEGLAGVAAGTSASRSADDAVTRRKLERAARLLGAAASLREVSGAVIEPHRRIAHERLVVAVRKELGEEAFAAAWQEWRAMTLQQVVCVAREECEIPITDRKVS